MQQRTLKANILSVKAVAFSPNGQLLASVSHDETIRLWDTRAGALQRTLEDGLSERGFFLESRAVAFSPDGQLLATVSLDGTVKL